MSAGFKRTWSSLCTSFPMLIILLATDRAGVRLKQELAEVIALSLLQESATADQPSPALC